MTSSRRTAPEPETTAAAAASAWRAGLMSMMYFPSARRDFVASASVRARTVPCVNWPR